MTPSYRQSLSRGAIFSLSFVGAMAIALGTQAAKPLGSTCTSHQECASLRCDNRPAAGCVAQDGTANGGDFCTTHQQCRTGLCNITPGTYTGKCSGSDRPLGQACVTHQECKSGRCDNRPGAGCVPQDGTGNASDFCTTHQQCRTGLCTIANGSFTGQCSAGNRPLGTACLSHGECTSQRCDNRPGAGCVAQDGTANVNDFCTTHQQCSSGWCNVTNGLQGTCAPGNLANGTTCHASSQCTSRNCSQGVCAAFSRQSVNPFPVLMPAHFNDGDGRSVFYTSRSLVNASTPTKKAVITSVKNTSKFLIRLTYKDSFGAIRNPSAVPLDVGATTNAFNNYDATALWEAVSMAESTRGGETKTMSIEISWKEQ
jgi:hypothetical protein